MEGPVDVGFDERRGIVDAAIHMGFCRKMDHCIDRIALKNLVELFLFS